MNRIQTSKAPAGKVAVIGAGISGLTVATCLRDAGIGVVVYERKEKPGGLIRCDQLAEGLYHKVGGHVFNTKSAEVDRWFWSKFDKTAFRKVTRNAKILLLDRIVDYPIENHLYQLPQDLAQSAIKQIAELARTTDRPRGFASLGEYFEATFGAQLNEMYFQPYNEKVWQTDLKRIPLEWLEGKLPMPSPLEILENNILRTTETGMVHSQFYYPKNNGSQFIVDTLASGLDIRLESNPFATADGSGWQIDGDRFDAVVYTGDIRRLGDNISAAGLPAEATGLEDMRTRGITNAFCECDHTELTWLYIPDPALACNRIIYTGALSNSNNKTERMTCVVEFPPNTGQEKIQSDIAALPGSLRFIARNDAIDAYIIQATDTRERVAKCRDALARINIFLVGRFAEWEYYNMDKAMEAALRVASSLTAIPR